MAQPVDSPQRQQRALVARLVRQQQILADHQARQQQTLAGQLWR